MNPIGVIFDMDGVLVDSIEPHYQSWCDVAEKYNLNVTRDVYDKCFGQKGFDIIRAFGGTHLSDDQMQQLLDEKEALYRDIIRHDFPEGKGAKSFINDLHQHGVQLAIGSSGPKENVEAVIDAMGIHSIIQVAISGCDISHGKPAPEVFLRAAEKMGMAPNHCVVIEDALVGIEAARRAGMKVVAVTGTVERTELTAVADRVVDTLTELSCEDIERLCHT